MRTAAHVAPDAVLKRSFWLRAHATALTASGERRPLHDRCQCHRWRTLRRTRAGLRKGSRAGRAMRFAVGHAARALLGRQPAAKPRCRIARPMKVKAFAEMDARPCRRHVARGRRAGSLHRRVPRRRAAGFPLIEPGRRGWLYTVLAHAELERGDPDAAAQWVARQRDHRSRPAPAARRGMGAARARC